MRGCAPRYAFLGGSLASGKQFVNGLLGLCHVLSRSPREGEGRGEGPVSYTHLRAHETSAHL
eukprot:9722983-Alexandrium_andersonii.AAC.1